MKTVDKGQWVVHRSRAVSFIDGMRLLSDDLTAYAGAVALLAVHATLSLNDAVRILHTGRRGSDADHRAASGHLKRLCALRRIDEAGVQHLRWLLSHKTDFAYGDRRVGDDEIKAAVSKAEKFAAWVFRSFPEVAHEDEPGARS